MYLVLKRLPFLLLISLFLVACGTTTSVEVTPDTEHHYVASVDIDESMTQAELEATYGGEAILFKPEAGFALLGFSKEAGELTTLSTTINQDAWESPEFSAQAADGAGFSAWAGGFSAWAGGWSAWAGGWSAWAGGWSAWAGGTIPAPPEVNANVWEQINLYEAHKVSRNFGAGVKVAVIDTGIDLNHPMFEGRLAPKSEWRDYIDNDNDPSEEAGRSFGHGTGVAGIILQVAPQATILPIRVLDGDGKGDSDDVTRAIIHAVNAGARVINMSLGTLNDDDALYFAVRYAGINNVYMASSSGNYGPDVDVTRPAMYYKDLLLGHQILGVGSLDANGEVSSFTSYGSTNLGIKSTGTHSFAPGENIFSAYPGNKMAHYTGTSFAAPLLAGTVALTYSEIPNKKSFSFFAPWMPTADLGLSGFDMPLDVAIYMQGQKGWVQTVSNTFEDSDNSPSTETLRKSGNWISSAGRSHTSWRNPKYSFEVTQAGNVTIDLTSLIDTYLYLLDSSGSVIARNNNGGEGYNSRISIDLSEGTYEIVAATYWWWQAGSFLAQVEGYVSDLN